MHARTRSAVVAAGVVLAVLVLGGLWLTARGGSDESEAAGQTGATVSPTGAALPAPTSFPSAPADVPGASATVEGTGSAASGTQVLEPGPDATVATDPPAARGEIAVVVTYADWVDGGVEVDGYVAGVVEDGGTCRLTLTRGDDVQTVEGVAASDASTTTCGSLIVAGGGLTAGDWSAVLTYDSTSSSGSSAPSVVAVPVR